MEHCVHSLLYTPLLHNLYCYSIFPKGARKSVVLYSCALLLLLFCRFYFRALSIRVSKCWHDARAPEKLQQTGYIFIAPLSPTETRHGRTRRVPKISKRVHPISSLFVHSLLPLFFSSCHVKIGDGQFRHSPLSSSF